MANEACQSHPYINVISVSLRTKRSNPVLLSLQTKRSNPVLLSLQVNCVNPIHVSLRTKCGNLIRKMHFYLTGLPRRYAPRNDISKVT